jgi:hypothetical protein
MQQNRPKLSHSIPMQGFGFIKVNTSGRMGPLDVAFRVDDAPSTGVILCVPSPCSQLRSSRPYGAHPFYLMDRGSERG